jgi:cell wall-associated NlpC family hydrolase
MRSVAHVRLALAWAALTALTPDASAQSIEVRAGRFFEADQWAVYRIGLRRPLTGILGVQLHADLLKSVDANGGMAGVGADVTAFRTGSQGPYLVAGLSGGLGSQTSSDLSDGWGSWSAGAGYDVFPASFLSVGLEGRWRALSLGRREGFELAAGLTLHLGSSAPPAGPRPVPGPINQSPALPANSPSATYSALQAEPVSLADSIVATAAAAMGRPYEFGGTGTGGGGFDCSGLIQYAYKKHGIALARRSVDQAKEGRKVGRKLDQLRPADLLTFSNRGGPVTHVGLYVGGGRFIHSATRGVQISTLSPQDPYGRWWYSRWVGVRRIVQ